MFDYLICTRHFLHAANYLSFAYFLSYYFTLFNKPIYVKKINEWWREMYKIVTELNSSDYISKFFTKIHHQQQNLHTFKILTL